MTTAKLLKPGPMSNAERQKRFRLSHPGYNKKYRGPSGPKLRALQAQVRADLARAMADEAAANAETADAGIALPLWQLMSQAA